MILKMEKLDEKLNCNIAKVSKTLDGIREVMRKCVEVLSNISARHTAYYHQQMSQLFA